LTDLERPSSTIDGVRYGAIERHTDARGVFRELWRASARAASAEPTSARTASAESASAKPASAEPASAEPASAALDPFVQANLSTSSPGVLRGLHLHRRQQDHWLVTAGRAFVALVDVRPMLADPVGGSPIVETRELVEDEWVDIPVGVAHGFLALTVLELIYFVTNEYDGSDELGFAWDDPQANVPWPELGEALVLSERDQTNPRLAELVTRLQTAR
jgi:dTDP-4-dehydrorhamnose 3,5-epimerase